MHSSPKVGWLIYFMRLLASIGIGLLVLILIMQVRIISRLDEAAKRPITVSPSYSYSPNTSEIAAEVRRQLALDEPPIFSFQPDNWSGGSDGSPLVNVVFRMTREAGPASDISIKTMPDTTVLVKSDNGGPDHSIGNDYYKITFKPQSGELPECWTFCVSYVGHDGLTGERSFCVLHDLDKNNFQITSDTNAIEIRRRLISESSPTFYLSTSSWSHERNGGPAIKMSLTMARSVGSAKDVSIKAPDGINAEVDRTHSSPDLDYYYVTFKPVENQTLPTSWRFSVSYTGHDGTAGEYPFDIAYDSYKKDWKITKVTVP